MADTENPNPAPRDAIVGEIPVTEIRGAQPGEPIPTLTDSFTDDPAVQKLLGRTAGDHKTPAPSAHEYLGRAFALLDDGEDLVHVGEKLYDLRTEFRAALAASEGAGTPA